MTVRGLALDPVTNAPIVILKAEGGTRLLPIWIGLFEANAIAIEMEKIVAPRPMTHDLLKNMIELLDARMERMVVDNLQENTFFASIYLRSDGREHRLDARPSDAIALALRTGAPILSPTMFSLVRAASNWRRISVKPISGGNGSIILRRGTLPGTPREGPPPETKTEKGPTVQMDDDIKGLLDHMSDALKDAIRGSEKIQELLHEIENRGYTPSMTVGVVLGRTGTGERAEEIQETLIGPVVPERPVSIRRLSAFDRKFLRACAFRCPRSRHGCEQK